MKTKAVIVFAMALSVLNCAFAESRGLVKEDINQIQVTRGIVKSLGDSKSAQWYTYQAAIEPGNGTACFTVSPGAGLSGRRTTFANTHSDPSDSEFLDIYFLWEERQVQELFFSGDGCRVDVSEKKVVHLSGVSQRRSVEFLRPLLNQVDRKTRKSRRLSDHALTAIALHKGDFAHKTLFDLTSQSDSKMNRRAIFWLGEARNKAGFESLVLILGDDSRDIRARKEAVFALSENSYAGSDVKFLQLARSAKDEEIQMAALFWLAQSNHAEILLVIDSVLESDRSVRVKDEAVFAISQLSEPEATDGLISILKGSHNKRAKKQALFWLGQSENPRAFAALEDIFTASTK